MPAPQGQPPSKMQQVIVSFVAVIAFFAAYALVAYWRGAALVPPIVTKFFAFFR